MSGSAFQRLVVEFRRGLPARLEALAAELTEDRQVGPRAAVIAAVHELAGSCGLYGQTGASEALAEIEQRLRALATQPVGADADLAAIRTSLAAIAREVE